MTPFLITGLPRSRTAWMAEVATFRRSVCVHEPWVTMDRWDDIFTTLWNARSVWDFVGISDHGMGFHLPEVMRRLAPRTLIIERPIEAVSASLDLIGLPNNRLFLDLLSRALAYQHPQILRVPYDDLSRTGFVVRCLEWLMPGAEIDIRRIDDLQYENIQALGNIDKGRSRAADVANFFPADVLATLGHPKPTVPRENEGVPLK